MFDELKLGFWQHSAHKNKISLYDSSVLLFSLIFFVSILFYIFIFDTNFLSVLLLYGEKINIIFSPK